MTHPNLTMVKMFNAIKGKEIYLFIELLNLFVLKPKIFYLITDYTPKGKSTDISYC